MKSLLLIIVLFLVAGKVNAQLPSEKPLSQVYSPMIKAKLEAPKDASADTQLPSERKTLPKAAEESKLKNVKRKQPGQNDAAKLPSNKKLNTTSFRKPAQSNKG